VSLPEALSIPELANVSLGSDWFSLPFPPLLTRPSGQTTAFFLKKYRQQRQRQGIVSEKKNRQYPAVLFFRRPVWGDQVMPNDAKLGLVLGVSLVITVAVIFFRKDLPGNTRSSDPSATIVKSVTLPPPSANGMYPVPARFITRGENTDAGQE
jgi:hypothetical protein